MGSDGGHWHWAGPGDRLIDVAMAYADLHEDHQAIFAAYRNGRQPLVLDGSTLSESEQTAIARRQYEILQHPRNRERPFPSRHLPNGDLQFTAWIRIWIPEDKVDIVEAYVRSTLEPLGLRVFFIEDWWLHRRFGELHCATNVRRKPHATPWWEHYDPSLNLRYTP